MSAVMKSSTKTASPAALGDRLDAWWATKSLAWSVTERVRLYEILGRFVDQSIPLDDGLAKMLARTNRPRGLFKRAHPMRHVYHRWLTGLRAGKAFTDPSVAGNDLPPGELIMIMMGQQTQRVGEGFARARFVADVVRRMKTALVGALTYPVILLLMAAGFLTGIAFKFGPQMLQMTDDPVETWPWLSRTLYGLSVFVKDYGLWLAVVFVAATAASLWSLSRWHQTLPRLRRFVDHWVPPWSIYREYNASSFLIALGEMVKSTTPVDEAIARVISISAPWMQWHLRRILARVRRGDDPGQSFDTGLLSDETLGYIEDFNSAGGLDSALSVVGAESVEASIARVRAGAMVIGNVGLVVVASLILLIYGGMIALGYMIYQKAQMGG